MKSFKVWFLLAAMTLVGCGNPENGDSGEDPQAGGTLTGSETDEGIECDIQIATFIVPEGWTVFYSDGPTAAILLPVGDNPQAATQMVTIDVGTPADPDIHVAATAFAENYGGTIADTEFEIAGAGAYRVTTPPSAGEIIPRDTLATVKDGKLILAIYATKDVDPGNVLDQLASTWKWKQP